MSRRRGRVRKNVPHTISIENADAVLAEVDLDGDGPTTGTYDWAVMTVLEALEGLWFESNDPVIENEVNQHVQRIKKQIQESL